MRKLLAIMLVIFVSSCTNNITKHGYIFDNDDLKMVRNGVTDKQTLLNIMGSPTIISDVDYGKEAWIYYSEEVEDFLFFKPEIVDRRIMLVEFDKEGYISNLQNLSELDEIKNFKFASDYTAVDNHGSGFFKSLFSNVGQVKPQ